MGIGIDFGSTNSAAVYQGQGELVLGVLDPFTPKPDSSMLWVSNKFATYFGSRPPNLANYSPIRKLKGHLGSQPQITSDGRSYDSVDLATKYMTWMKERLANIIGLDLLNGPRSSLTVASVPNRSWPGYRERLRDCLQNAGFNSVRFVYEPTAAAVACLHEAGAFQNPAMVSGPVLIIDWGGGTVDVSLMELKPNGTLMDINTEGQQSGMGGADMDEWLAEKAASANPDLQFAFSQLGRSDKNNVLSSVEVFKVKCINQMSNNFPCPEETIILPGSDQLAIIITEQHVQECVNLFCKKVQEVALRATSAAGVSIDDIRHKIFVGGPFQSDFIRENKNFSAWKNARLLVYSRGPQFATVAGCALLAQKGFEQRLACDIGVLEADGSFFKVAKKNEAFPAVLERWREPIMNPHSFQFQATDLACSEALFEFGRTSGWNGIDSYIPIGRVQVPVAHSQLSGAEPICSYIWLAYLDSDLNFGVHVVGTQGQLNNGSVPVVESKYDCLPISLSIL